MGWSRRRVLTAGAAAGLVGLLRPRLGVADGAAGPSFLFVFATGGWDTTRVFSPMGHAPRVQTEPEAVAVEHGALTYVDHPERPAVRRFFERYGDRVAVLDGMLVRSVNHDICERLVQTGSARAERPDWGSILGSAALADHALPNLVLSGPSNPGDLHRITSIVGTSGQLQGLLDGAAFRRGDVLPPAYLQPSRPTQHAIDALLQDQAAARLASTAEPAARGIAEAHLDALQRAERLADDAAEVSLSASLLRDELFTAVDLLAAGIARCVGTSKSGFDTHGDTTGQSPLLEELFDGLDALMQRLRATPGRSTPTMADETVVVVLSEMGRTPYLNSQGGKDHWPYTAAMLWGPGVRGGRRIGGYDDFLSGQALDPVTGDLRSVEDGGLVITPEHLGATLLALGAMDPTPWVAAPPISALLT